MTELFQKFSANTAPPGHITFSALDNHNAGHSVILATKDFSATVKQIQKNLTGGDKRLAFKAAITVLLDSVGCDAHDHNCNFDGNLILASFVAALISHPDPYTGKLLLKELKKTAKKKRGAHLIFLAPPYGPFAWMIAGPSKAGRV